MLTMSKPLSAGQAGTYHATEFANAKANYYAEGDTIIGRWHGRLAQSFGLRGEVTEEHFKRLADGQHPLTGATLIRKLAAHTYTNAQGETVRTMEHRAGWDATFSAPKSVSLVALVGGDDRVHLAHRESVAVALHELEAFTQARLGGARLPETTGAFAAAAFEHDSARPVDGYSAPQLHTHAVVFNVTRTSQDRLRSVQPRELYKSQAYATAVYRAELAQRLVALGYAVERGASGQPEVKGFTREYLEAASPRRKQIQEQLEASGRGGAAAAQVAALQTRERKLAHGKDDVQRQHQAMAAAFGSQPQRAVAAALAAGHSLKARPPVEPAARDALMYAKARNIERAAVVDERSILTDALRRGMAHTATGDIRREFGRRALAGEFLARTSSPGGASRAWTTPEMVALEQTMIARMSEGREQYAPMIPDAIREAVDRDAGRLSASQRQAVRTILSGRDQVTALDGVAGSGKTTTLATVREAAERAGYVVEGLAPTSRAAVVLSEAGMRTQTLQRYLAHNEPRDGTPRLTVLDESSLASTALMTEFLSRMQPRDRVLLVGDVRQHQSVDAGKAYEQLQEAGVRTARLSEIVRQPEGPLRTVVQRLAEGDVRAAIGDLRQLGNVHAIPDRTARLEALTAAVLREPEGTLVVCPDNESRQDINAAVHRALQAARTVAPDQTPTRVLVARQDMTGADRAYADRYDVGDTVRYTKGSQALGLDAGEYAVVTSTDRASNQLTVQRTAGDVVSYDPRRLHGVSVYQAQERSFAVGDRVQFTAPSRELQVANRQMGIVRELAGDQVRVQLDTGREVNVSMQSHPHLDFGYAVTSHSSQGQTADRVIVHIDSARSAESIVNQRLAYVALSRGRHDAQIYTDDLAALTRNLERDVSHRTAIELKQPMREQQLGG